jgi:hypothetical protein
MTYNMDNVQGKTAKATAMVMFPKVAQPADGYRVVVWEHGTVGLEIVVHQVIIKSIRVLEF